MMRIASSVIRHANLSFIDGKAVQTKVGEDVALFHGVLCSRGLAETNHLTSIFVMLLLIWLAHIALNHDIFHLFTCIM